MTIALLNGIEDDAECLKAWMEEAGLPCSLYFNLSDFQKNIIENNYEAIVVFDCGLHSIEFIRNDVCGLIPIVYIGSESDFVSAFELGVDGCLSKTLPQFESIARIKAVFRRLDLKDCLDDGQYVLDYSPFKIDVDKKGFYFSNQKIELTRKEYDLVLYLFRHVGKLISRGRLLQVVWGTSPELSTRTVDAHISRLRSKLNINPNDSGWELKSVYKKGYCLAKVPE